MVEKKLGVALSEQEVSELLEKQDGYEEVIEYLKAITEDESELDEVRWMLREINYHKYYEKAKDLLECDDPIARVKIALWELYEIYNDEDEIKRIAEEIEGITIESEEDLERIRERYIELELERFWDVFWSAIKKAEDETGIEVKDRHQGNNMFALFREYSWDEYILEFYDYADVNEILEETEEYYCEEISDYDYFRAVKEADKIIEERQSRIKEFIDILEEELKADGFDFVLKR